jgi:hypothetical protein
MRVYRSGAARDCAPIKRLLKPHSAIEPVIGHMKEVGGLGRNFLQNRHGGLTDD